MLRLVNAGLSQTRATRFTDRSIPFVVPPTQHDTTETREKEEREADRCSREMQWAKYARAGLGSNYYSWFLNAPVVLNMARAALIREREFRRARAPACIPGQKPESAAANVALPPIQEVKNALKKLPPIWIANKDGARVLPRPEFGLTGAKQWSPRCSGILYVGTKRAFAGDEVHISVPFGSAEMQSVGEK